MTEGEWWLAEVPCDWHRSMLRQAAVVLPGYPGVVAVLVTGSLASSDADRLSDLDVLCVVEDDDLGWWDSGWREAIEAVAGPLVLANPIGGTVDRGYVAITSRWEHVDLLVRPTSTFDAPSVARALFDPRGLAAQTSDPAPPEPAGPYYPGAAIELFLYLLGAGAVTLGRGEVLLAQAGVLALREQLVAVMLGENGVRRSGGAKRLNDHLSEAQRATLLKLSVVAPDVAGILRIYHAISVETVVRARALAALCDSAFPDAMLEATDAYLGREFGKAWVDLGPISASPPA